MNALYIHIPFCKRKCPYCDFLSFPGMGGGDFSAYEETVKRELELWRGKGIAVDTVFFGGGTPTLIGADALVSILDKAYEVFDIADNAEITTEANPGTIDRNGLKTLFDGGFDRISFGVQSFDDRILKNIGRIHDGDTAKNAVLSAYDAGFRNISLDLMSGLPGQSASDLIASIDIATELPASHISCYDLTLAEGTPFAKGAKDGTLILPDDDSSADMLFSAWERLEALGFEHYEISNFARFGKQSRHNMHYWMNDDYIGIGCGAHGKLGMTRYFHNEELCLYRKDVEKGLLMPVVEENMSDEDEALEAIMTGLRTKAGVDPEKLMSNVPEDTRLKWRSAMENAARLGFAESINGRFCPTEDGWKVQNAWLVDFF